MGKPLKCISTKGKWAYKFRLNSLYWKLLGWEDFWLSYFFFYSEVFAHPGWDNLWQDSSMTRKSQCFIYMVTSWTEEDFIQYLKWFGVSSKACLHGVIRKQVHPLALWSFFFCGVVGKFKKYPSLNNFCIRSLGLETLSLYILSFSRLKLINHHQPLWRCTESTGLGATSLAFNPRWPRSLKASSDPALHPVLWVARVPPFSAVVTAVPITTERGNNGLNLRGPTISGQCC